MSSRNRSSENRRFHGSNEADSDVLQLRNRFLAIGAKLYPDMIDDLRKQVSSGETAAMKSVKAAAGARLVNRYRVTHAVAGWQAKWDRGHNDWIARAAQGTIESWGAFAPTNCSFAPLGARDTASQTLEEQISRQPELAAHRNEILESRRSILNDQNAPPSLSVRISVDPRNSNRQIEQRARRETRRVIRKAATALRVGIGLIPTADVSDADLEMVARYHFGGDRFSSIASSQSRNASDPADVVKRRVRKTAKAIGLELRSPDKPGRPRLAPK